MSIFATTVHEDSHVLSGLPALEGYDQEVNGDILAIEESFDDHLALIESLHAIDMEEIGFRSDVQKLTEATEIESRTADYEAVTESLLGDAWSKIKAFFVKLYQKIKGFLQSIVRQFDALTKSGKDFAKKYSEPLNKLNLSGFTVSGYKFTSLDDIDFSKLTTTVTTKLNGFVGELESAANGADVEKVQSDLADLKAKRTETLDQLRGLLLDKSSLSPEQFSKEIFAKFHGGAQGKAEKIEQAVDIKAVLQTLSSELSKKQIGKFQKSINDDFAKAIKLVNTLQSKLKSAKADDNGNISAASGDTKFATNNKVVGPVLDGLRFYSSMFSSVKNAELQVFRGWKSAYAERSTFLKSVCLKAYHHKVEKKNDQATA